MDVITVVEAAIEHYGSPEHIRSDNGHEFIAYAIQNWLSDQGDKTLYITPGSAWEWSSSDIEPPKEGPQGEA